MSERCALRLFTSCALFSHKAGCFLPIVAKRFALGFTAKLTLLCFVARCICPLMSVYYALARCANAANSFSITALIYPLVRQALPRCFLTSLANLWIFAGGHPPIVSKRFALCVSAICAVFGHCTAGFDPIVLGFHANEVTFHANRKLLTFGCIPSVCFGTFHSATNLTFLVACAKRGCPSVSKRISVSYTAKGARAWCVTGCFFPRMRAKFST